MKYDPSDPEKDEQSVHLGKFHRLKDIMSQPKKDEIIEGNIVLVMFKLAWPLMISSFLMTLYNLVDTIWLGRLPGEEARYSVGAMGMSWSVVFLMMGLGMGFGIAALALISQHTGAKQFEEANRDAGQLYILAILFSMVVGVIGYLLTPFFLDFLTGSGAEAAALASYGTQYLQIIFLGLPFMFMFFSFSFILRGWGDTITPMIITAVSVFINIILDPILIFGFGPIPKMGIQGAAIATVATRGIGALIGLYLLFHGNLGIRLKLSYLIPDFTKIKKLLSIGIPASLGREGSAMGFILIWYFINRLPNQEIAAAAYGSGNRILNITFLVMGGLAMAMSTMVGQSLGAQKKGRAEEVTKKGIILLFGLMGAIAIVLFLLRNILIAFIIPGDPAVIGEGGNFLMIFALAMPFFGVFRGITGVLEGSGHTVQQMILSLSRLWALRIPLVYIFAFIIGWYSSGVWLGMALSNVIAAGLALFVFSLGRWKEKVIEEGPKSKFVIDDEKGKDI
ncbi:MAG: MATE family efflux transporter [Thermoplasmata archaeon]